MRKEQRTLVYDETLGVEAYRLEGMIQNFPNHFHEHYVIGYLEQGNRGLSCKNREYRLQKGDVTLFNPGDNHCCVALGGQPMDYRGINVPKETMLSLVQEVTGGRELMGFSENVIPNATVAQEVICYLGPLHESIVSGSREFEKEEYLLFLISLLLHHYGSAFQLCVPVCSLEMERACEYMENNFSESISLQAICRYAGLSKSTLLRAFTKEKGITPYRYLESIRMNAAKKLLENGMSPIEAALQTGFSDQSHFTNHFSRFMGLTPGMYGDISAEKRKQGDV